MSNNSGLILPPNLMPRVGEKQIAVGIPPSQDLIFLEIQDSDGKPSQIPRATLTKEQAAAVVGNLLEALRSQGVHVEVDGKQVVN